MKTPTILLSLSFLVVFATEKHLYTQQNGISFKAPTLAEQTLAVGRLDGLSEIKKRAFAITDDFKTIRSPAPNDWLASFEETPQTFDAFSRSTHSIPSSSAPTIYLQPLSDFAKDRSPELEDLREYCSAFFGLKVQVLPTLVLTADSGVTSRVRTGGMRQYLTTDILALLKKRLPRDGFCMIGVTMEDLYPDEKWNFVFGEAEASHRVGIFSFKRYTPEWSGKPWNKETKCLLLRRSCDVLAHETGHIFGLDHCTYFECVMCGSNHQAESDSRPMHCCPVCLRKLHSSARFDLVDRYQTLMNFYDKRGLKNEAEWVRKVLARLTAKP